MHICRELGDGDSQAFHLFSYVYLLIYINLYLYLSESWVMETLKLGIKAVGVGKAQILKSQFSLFTVRMIYWGTDV